VSVERPSVVVVGGSNLDVKARAAAPMQPGTSNPGTGAMAAGGVGRNIAENLARLGTRTLLVSAVGRDAAGEMVLAQSLAAGVELDLVHRTDRATGTYVALLDAGGELVAAVSDMTATDELGPMQVGRARDAIAAASLLVLDGNLLPVTLAAALDVAHAAGVRAILEPVSAPKAARLAGQLTTQRPLYAITPNRDELEALTGTPARTPQLLCAAADELHSRGVRLVWVRLGDAGSVLSERLDDGSTTRTDLAAVPTTVDDVTGAGDAMLAAFCHAVLDGADPVAAARLGHAAAALTIASPSTVRPDLTPDLLRSVVAGAERPRPHGRRHPASGT
jgi:pseudouridine kinase